jgi:hypothetical protein
MVNGEILGEKLGTLTNINVLKINAATSLKL